MDADRSQHPACCGCKSPYREIRRKTLASAAKSCLFSGRFGALQSLPHRGADWQRSIFSRRCALGRVCRTLIAAMQAMDADRSDNLLGARGRFFR